MSCNCIKDNNGNLVQQIRQQFIVVKEKLEQDSSTTPDDTSPDSHVECYKKPATGIPVTDLSSSVVTSLNKANTAYQKPTGGIPLSHLSAEVIALLNAKSDSTSTTEVLNIEEASVHKYVNIMYNNDDYSYTNMNLLDPTKVGNNKNIYKFWLPNTKVINIPTSNNAKVLEIADNVEFENKRIVNLSASETTYELANLIPNKHYYYRVKENNNIISNGDFITEGQVRFLKIEAIYNTGKQYVENGVTKTAKYRDYLGNARDIGGWKTYDGHSIKYGVIFRGEQLDNDERDLNNNIIPFLGEKGIQELLRVGVSAELDLRGEADRNDRINEVYTPRQSILGVERIYNANNGVHTINVHYGITSIMNGFIINIRYILGFLQANKNVYIHCAGGCDRTGGLIFMLEGLLGVSEDNLCKDYELSYRTRHANLYVEIKKPDYNSNVDGGFRTLRYRDAIEYIKNIKKYDNALYTKFRGYPNSKIIINGTTYNRGFVGVNSSGEPVQQNPNAFRTTNISINNILYYAWTTDPYNNAATYYTTDIYPTVTSKVYTYDGSSMSEVDLTISSFVYDYYYKIFDYDLNTVPSMVHGYAIPISDETLINTLDNMPKPTLKEQFRFLLSLPYNNTTGLTDAEYNELEQYLLV